MKYTYDAYHKEVETLIKGFKDLDPVALEDIHNYYSDEIRKHLNIVTLKTEFEIDLTNIGKIFYGTGTIDVYNILTLLLNISKALCGQEADLEDITTEYKLHNIPESMWDYIYPIVVTEKIGINVYMFAFANNILLLPIYINKCSYDELVEEMKFLTYMSELWEQRKVISDMYNKILDIPDIKTKELLVFVLWYLVHELKILPFQLANEFKHIVNVEYKPRQSGIMSKYLPLEEYKESIQSTLYFYNTLLHDNSIISGLLSLGDEFLSGPEYWGEDDVFDFLVYVLVYLTS